MEYARSVCVQCAVSRVQCVCGGGKAEVEYVCCVVLVCAVLVKVLLCVVLVCAGM